MRQADAWLCLYVLVKLSSASRDFLTADPLSVISRECVSVTMADEFDIDELLEDAEQEQQMYEDDFMDDIEAELAMEAMEAEVCTLVIGPVGHACQLLSLYT